MGPKEPRSTVLTNEEDALAVAFRKHPSAARRLPLRLTDHHPASKGVGPAPAVSAPWHQQLPEVKGDKTPKKKFKPYPIGFFHIDIAEVRTEEGKLHLFVAIDRTSKFAFAQLLEKANRVTALAFLEALIEAVPYAIHTVLTDNGIQFTLPPRYAEGPTACYVTPHV